MSEENDKQQGPEEASEETSEETSLTLYDQMASEWSLTPDELTVLVRYGWGAYYFTDG